MIIQNNHKNRSDQNDHNNQKNYKNYMTAADIFHQNQRYQIAQILKKELIDLLKSDVSL